MPGLSRRLAVITLLWLAAGAALAGGDAIPRAVTVDPPADPRYPARSEVIQVPTGGVTINGLVYVAAGPGPHPLLLMLNGLPGNEKNGDLLQAVRRAGWDAASIFYRGSWGSPGAFRFAHTLEDAKAALAYLRAPANAARLGIDPARIVLAGHSMGGWVTLLTAAEDHTLLGAIAVSAADLGAIGHQAQQDHAAAVAFLADNGGTESLVESTCDSQADELAAHAEAWSFARAAPGLTDSRLLVLSSHDPFEQQSAALVGLIRQQGGHQVTARRVETDHVWSDHRIGLAALLVDWLQGLPR